MPGGAMSVIVERALPLFCTQGIFRTYRGTAWRLHVDPSVIALPAVVYCGWRG